MFPFDISRPIVGKASVEINKPVDHVFHFVGERFFDNYPKWALEVSEFKPLTGDGVYVGAKAEQTRQEQGQKVRSVLEVSEFEPPQKVTLTGVDAPIRNTYQFYDHGRKDSTKLEYSFELMELELYMRPFEKLIRHAIEEGAENTVENIKNLLADESQ
jgi:Polyketide cyclase / dehydrase and lipid transport